MHSVATALATSVLPVPVQACSRSRAVLEQRWCGVSFATAVGSKTHTCSKGMTKASCSDLQLVLGMQAARRVNSSSSRARCRVCHVAVQARHQGMQSGLRNHQAVWAARHVRQPSSRVGNHVCHAAMQVCHQAHERSAWPVQLVELASADVAWHPSCSVPRVLQRAQSRAERRSGCTQLSAAAHEGVTWWPIKQRS